ncbi:unnamed protein product, partial [Mesorhabditis spiculigera]
MPLGGLFGGGSKAQPLSNEAREKGKGKDGKDDKDARGTQLHVHNHNVVVDKKLAEGGFAIVYLVVDKKNRQFALKRQFINDDLKQVEACRRESQIISSLRGHKNIVEYVDHSLEKNKAGVYDYMLLTAYYKTSVLGVMNEKLVHGKGFSPSEVLAIFCDMCEAVARLHHSNTPVIHRDLKVENILVDERNRGAAPIYVLCDFGSATTRVLSTDAYPISAIQEEIERYTTLSYRAPEMIDLYSGRPIGTKADIWALGVMLYKLCYFALPFGDSALAIQNGAVTFPATPEYPVEIRTIIRTLLNANSDMRPNVYQTSALASDAAKRPNPVHNIEKVTTPSLERSVADFLEGRVPGKEATVAYVKVEKKPDPPPQPSPQLDPMRSSQIQQPQTTSVNPRLRPKPTNSVPRLPNMACASPQLQPRSTTTRTTSNSEPDLPPTTSQASSTVLPPPEVDLGPLSCPLMKADASFDGLDEIARRPRRTEGSAETVTDSSRKTSHVRNVSDCSTIIKSAFKPYSQTKESQGEERQWNPFTSAPYGTGEGMDDSRFGACFDELPRNSNQEGRREDSSDMDEAREASRRRFSYEHIDGVGDDASSDSRARTEDDSNTDDQKLDDDEDEADASLTTEGGAQTDEEGGSRPLLDDDELEMEHEDNDALWIEPAPPVPASAPVVAYEPPVVGTLVDVTEPETYREETVIYQAPPPVPSHKTSRSSAQNEAQRSEISLLSRSTENADSFSAVHAIASSSLVTQATPKGFGYCSPRTKKEKKKSVARKPSSSSEESPQTDDSGAEMFSSNTTEGKSKKGKHKLRGSHSSVVAVAPTELKLTPMDVQKLQKRGSSSKRGDYSAGAANASFVNSSFQAEDIDSPPRGCLGFSNGLLLLGSSLLTVYLFIVILMAALGQQTCRCVLSNRAVELPANDFFDWKEGLNDTILLQKCNQHIAAKGEQHIVTDIERMQLLDEQLTVGICLTVIKWWVVIPVFLVAITLLMITASSCRGLWSDRDYCIQIPAIVAAVVVLAGFIFLALKFNSDSGKLGLTMRSFLLPIIEHTIYLALLVTLCIYACRREKSSKRQVTPPTKSSDAAPTIASQKSMASTPSRKSPGPASSSRSAAPSPAPPPQSVPTPSSREPINNGTGSAEPMVQGQSAESGDAHPLPAANNNNNNPPTFLAASGGGEKISDDSPPRAPEKPVAYAGGPNPADTW